jgi:hypothetical protein
VGKKSSDKGLDKDDKVQPEVGATPSSEATSAPDDTPKPRAIKSQAMDMSLPVVISPKLDGSDADEESGAEAVHETQSEAASETASEPAAQTRSRFVLLAATIALAAALGSFAATLTASGLGRLMSAPEAVPALAPSTADAGSIAKALKSQLAELSAMKASVDAAAHTATTQFAAITDRLDHVERAQADAAAKLAHTADAADRLDKLATAAPETTGSIASSAAAPTEPKLTDRILQDWIVQGVRGDRALVESRYGGVFDVGAGSVLPGLGRVESVKRQDGQWIVVTARGLITSGH